MIKIGFTGTRDGMTPAQRVAFLKFLQNLYAADEETVEFHHGDCQGADEDAHALLDYSIRVIGHPPNNPKLRAFCDCDELRVEKGYLARDYDIVDETDLLIAAPKTAEEQVRSGTWLTVRYAREQRRPVWLILPDGKIEKDTVDSTPPEEV